MIFIEIVKKRYYVDQDSSSKNVYGWPIISEQCVPGSHACVKKHLVETKNIKFEI